MSQIIVGDQTVKFGVDGATGPGCIGIVESLTITTTPDTTVEARGPKGDYETGKSEITFIGEKQDYSITGYYKDGSPPPAPGDVLTLTKGTDMKSTLLTKLIVVTSEVSGSAGDLVRCTVTGVAHKDLQ